MTALTKYDRIEASGLWRAGADAQRREVVASIGDATLVISDLKDQALTHWSLPAVIRSNPGQWPALYHPDGDPDETLELEQDEEEMVNAIEKLRTAIDKQRPRPGRLRIVITAGMTASVLALGVFWLPGALIDHTVSVVPSVKRYEIGQRLLRHVERVTGPSCRSERTQPVLEQLAARLQPANNETLKLSVVPSGMPATVMLPGQILVMNARLVEDYELPDIAAGFVLAEILRAQKMDPLEQLLRNSGPFSSLKLLTTGTLPDALLRSHAEALLSQTQEAPAPEALLDAFASAQVKASPYAYAIDVSGETTFQLIEADPYPAAAPKPVLSDGEWLRLQAICED
ncbi:MAG: hypothetical protein JXR13_17170 [Thalassovita sp.]